LRIRLIEYMHFYNLIAHPSYNMYALLQWLKIGSQLFFASGLLESCPQNSQEKRY
jgi:hypothetical protein